MRMRLLFALVFASIFVAIAPAQNGAPAIPQREGGGSIVTGGAIGFPFPISYQPSFAFTDANGNLLILETIFALPQPNGPVVAPHTKITVIPFSLSGVPPAKGFEYNGVFGVVAQGNQAVYATVIFSNSSTPGRLDASTFTLVALRVRSDGTLPGILPSLPLESFATVKVVAGTKDTIYIVPQLLNFPVPLAPSGLSIPAAARAPVQIVRFDGTGFTAPVSVSLP
ncbi:MAG TPA: hypothetical protein VGL91_05035 [Acidobacteriota bacterium]|jgi:hypothetical protein